ncbi:MAG: response regulator [Lachnospiraceae bacterium]|nr:response regulator [Lachnospiraceae bacterium]
MQENLSGKKCLELITKKKYDLIYLDHRMPDMDGLETRRRMEELQGNLNEDTPVIALTANAISGAKEEYLNYGFDDYLSKPVSTKSLEKSLLTHLPDDKIGAASEDAWCSDTADEPSDGVAVNGLDKEFAMLHLSDEALFKSAVKDFYGVIDLNADKLSDMYKDLPNENAWEGYRIQVHGMKSTAATIGIIPLAGLAKILEDASGERDIATVTTLHAIFIKRWRAYKEQLARIAEEDEAEARGSMPEASVKPSDNGKKKILVVDDDGAMLRTIKSMIEDEYEVHLAPSGAKAMASMEKMRPDLILLDYEMPVCDGRQTLEMIRAKDELASLPVIFLTSVNDRKQVSKALSMIPQGYLLKPLVREKLKATIRRALAEKNGI